MSKERLYIFDTTLRDGAQTQGVHFSLDEKTNLGLFFINFIDESYMKPSPAFITLFILSGII